MKAKEAGHILSIDQASNAAGACLYIDGLYIASTTLRAIKSSHSIGKRLVAQVNQLDQWLAQFNIEQIKVVIFEGVRSRLVLTTVGAFCTSPYLQDCKLHPRHSFVESSSWKTWAKKRGAVSHDGEIKGIRALYETGWDAIKYPIESDDAADSILIYQTWRDRV